MLGLIAIAMVLAIGFFYLAGGREKDAVSDAAISAANSVDKAAGKVGDATRDAGQKFEEKH
jgi:hypothetical protein